MKRLFACAAIAAGVSLTASAAYEDVTWLQYVEGNGSAYLKTDYTPNPAKDTITVDVELVAADSGLQTIFAARNLSTGGNTWSLLYLTDGTLRYDFGVSADTSSRYTSKTAYTPGRYTIVLDCKGATVNGTPVEFDKTFSSATFTPGGSLQMFAMFWDGAPANVSKMKLHSLRIDGDGFTHLYCPIKDGQGSVTMVDTLGSSVVTCAGTGALIEGPAVDPPAILVIKSVQPIRYAGYGVPSTSKVKVQAADFSTGKILKEGTDYTLDWTNTTHLGKASLKVKGLGKYENQVAVSFAPMVAKLPAGYTPLEYIESTGLEYIDLEIQPTGRTGLFTILDIANPQANNETYPSPFGARTSSGSYKLTGDLGVTQWSYVSDSGTEVKCQVYGAHEIEVDSIQDKGIFRVDGNTKQFTQTPALILSANAYLFAFNDLKGQAASVTERPVHLAKMKLTAFALLDDGEVKRDLVPCKADDGERGLYDLVSKTFFRNVSGNGAFTGDQELPPLPSQGFALILK